MNLPFNEAAIFLPFLIVIAIATAWYDMKEMKITNNTVLAMLGVFLVIGFFLMPIDVLGWRILIAAIVLVVTFIMSSLRMIGGGDAKFVAVSALFVASGDWISAGLLLILSMFTAVILVIVARVTPIRNFVSDWKCWHSGLYMPMGLSLGFALVFYYILAVLYPA